MAKKKYVFIKLAQIVPGAPPADLGVGAALPSAPAGAVPPPILPPVGVAGPQPNQPMSSESERPQITTALDTLGKILYDADVTEIIENDPGSGMEDIAAKLWEQYGGDERGGAVEDRIGNRSDEPMEPDQAEKEREITDNSRWERLPKGKHITDITSIDEINKVMNGLAMGTIKNVSNQQNGAAASGGAPAPMASKIRNTVKLANILDQCGYPHDADFLDYMVLN